MTTPAAPVNQPPQQCPAQLLARSRGPGAITHKGDGAALLAI